MEALKCLKEYTRMCNTYKDNECHGCPFEGGVCDISNPTLDYEMFVKTVSEWSENNPKNTFMNDFFKKFPNAPREASGVPTICPKALGYVPRTEKCSGQCWECWSRPMEE